MPPETLKFDLISVIIPVYNHEAYVEKTIRSIIEQTYKNIELIILNDGSNDNSINVITELREECTERFISFKFINQRNEGIVKTLNRGLQLAFGKYIYIIASDDVAEEDALTILHQFLSRNSDYGLVVGGNSLIDNRGKKCFWNDKLNITYDKNTASFLGFDDFLRKTRPDLDFLSGQFGAYANLLLGNHVPNGYLIEKAVIDRFGGYSEVSPLEDTYLMLQIAKSRKLKFLARPLFRYRWHDTNTSRDRDKMRQMERITLINEFRYCLLHGYFMIWWKRTRSSGFKYQCKRFIGLQVKQQVDWIFQSSPPPLMVAGNLEVRSMIQKPWFNLYSIRLFVLSTYDKSFPEKNETLPVHRINLASLLAKFLPTTNLPNATIPCSIS